MERAPLCMWLPHLHRHFSHLSVEHYQHLNFTHKYSFSRPPHSTPPPPTGGMTDAPSRPEATQCLIITARSEDEALLCCFSWKSGRNMWFVALTVHWKYCKRLHELTKLAKKTWMFFINRFPLIQWLLEWKKHFMWFYLWPASNLYPHTVITTRASSLIDAAHEAE